MVLTFLNVFSFTVKICVCIVSSILSHFYSVIMYNEKKHLCVFLNCARTQRLLCSFISCFFKILSRIQAITLPIVTECYNKTLMALISTCSLTQTGTLWGHTQSPAISHRRVLPYIKNILIFLQPPLFDLNCHPIYERNTSVKPVLTPHRIIFLSGLLAPSHSLIRSGWVWPTTLHCSR